MFGWLDGDGLLVSYELMVMLFDIGLMCDDVCGMFMLCLDGMKGNVGSDGVDELGVVCWGVC